MAYLVLPIFYLYTKSASTGYVDFYKWKNWISFVPFLMVMCLFGFNFFIQDRAKQELLTTQIIEGAYPLWYQVVYYGMFFGVFPYYLFASFRLLKRHENYILTKFSYKEEVSLAWLNRFLWGEGLVWVAFLIFEVLAHNFFQIVGEDIGFQAAFIILIACMIYLGIYGLRFQGVFMDREVERILVPIRGKEETIKYQSSSLSADKAKAYEERLQNFMMAEKPYLASKITIAELAQRMNMPVNHLSQLVNEQFNQNFFDFINNYRVKAFQQLVQERDLQQYTLLALAYEAGFNSKSSFNAIFKKTAGMTPSEYVKSLHPIPKTEIRTNT
jgi:AraC-like DNA-binding protein